jgi:hypothetical protein
MSQAEFDRWSQFYRDYPFDDLHRYHRPAALISVSMAGGEIQDKLNWLHPEPLPDGLSLADVNTMKAFGLSQESRGEK